MGWTPLFNSSFCSDRPPDSSQVPATARDTLEVWHIARVAKRLLRYVGLRKKRTACKPLSQHHSLLGQRSRRYATSGARLTLETGLHVSHGAFYDKEP